MEDILNTKNKIKYRDDINMTYKKIPKYIIATSLLCLSTFSNAGLLKIEINDLGGLSTTQAAIFDGATSFWESVLTGIQSAYDLVVTINAQGVPIDGVGLILGSAGPTAGAKDNGYFFATEGIMSFDTADLAAMESNGSLFGVIAHEMAHVLGFGTLWNTGSWGGYFTGTQNVYAEDSGQYTGTYALAEYRKEFDPTALFVPVELDGGPGTANGHWDELWAGGQTDLMTGYLDSPLTISRTTIAAFADIGFTTIVTHPVSAPTTLVVFFLGLFLVFSRRK